MPTEDRKKGVFETLSKYGQIINEEIYISSIAEVQKELESSIWKAEDIVKDFTYHKLTHSQGVLDKAILVMSQGQTNKLDAKECYILTMAALLHDVGMCVDISKQSKVLKRAKELGATSEPSKLDIKDISVQKYIRQNHNYLAVAYIEEKFSDIPEVDLIKECCLYHRGKSLQSINELEESHKKLVALFRLADELDIGVERISQGNKNECSRNAESQSYWELNEREEININENNGVSLVIYINEDDSKKNDVMNLMERTINSFKQKNGALFSILCSVGIKVYFDEFNSSVKVDATINERKIESCTKEFREFLYESLADRKVEKIIDNKIKLYEENLEEGNYLYKNYATVLMLPDEDKYVFFFYKEYKILVENDGYRGQVLCQKNKNIEMDNALYGAMDNLSLSVSDKCQSVKFDTYSRKRNSDGNWGEFCQTKFSETAQGRGYLGFVIQYQEFNQTCNDNLIDLDYNVGDEIGILYKYEIPRKLWGNFLRRRISCFYENAKVDLMIDSRYKDRLKCKKIKVHKAEQSASKENLKKLYDVLTIKPVDYKDTILGEMSINSWENEYKLNSESVSCYSVQLPVEQQLKYEKLEHYVVEWDSPEIFAEQADEQKTSGNDMSKISRG